MDRAQFGLLHMTLTNIEAGIRTLKQLTAALPGNPNLPFAESYACQSADEIRRALRQGALDLESKKQNATRM